MPQTPVAVVADQLERGLERVFRLHRVVRRRGKRGLQTRPLMLPAQTLLGLLAFGNVAHDPGVVAFVAHQHPAYCNIHRKRTAVLAPSHRLASDTGDVRRAGGKIAL